MCSAKQGILGRSAKSPAANKCNCSGCGLMFITWKYNTTSQLLSLNLLRQTCNVFTFNFIKLLLKQRDVLHIGCLVEKVINHIILI